MKKVVMALLIVSGVTLIVVAVSINTFPEWLSIPGGLLVLSGLALNTVLDIGNKLKGWVDLISTDKKSEPVSDVKLRISASVRVKENSPHIEVVVVNNERKTVFCKAKVHAIYDSLNKNIKRDISDYANHFSWSGGSDKGSKEIPAGLDGTINLVRTNYRGYGIAFMFDENPRAYWQSEGIYKIDLELAGTIEGDSTRIEFVGKRVTIEFQYRKNEIQDDYGQVINNGELKLLGKS